MSEPTVNSFHSIRTMAPGILFPSLPATHEGIRTNYTTCKLCGGEMLYDSCSKVCSREMCRSVLIHLGQQKLDYIEEFWRRFDARPRDASPLRLFDLEQLMAQATDEGVEAAA